MLQWSLRVPSSLLITKCTPCRFNGAFWHCQGSLQVSYSSKATSGSSRKLSELYRVQRLSVGCRSWHQIIKGSPTIYKKKGCATSMMLQTWKGGSFCTPLKLGNTSANTGTYGLHCFLEHGFWKLPTFQPGVRYAIFCCCKAPFFADWVTTILLFWKLFFKDLQHHLKKQPGWSSDQEQGYNS